MKYFLYHTLIVRFVISLSIFVIHPLLDLKNKETLIGMHAFNIQLRSLHENGATQSIILNILLIKEDGILIVDCLHSKINIAISTVVNIILIVDCNQQSMHVIIIATKVEFQALATSITIAWVCVLIPHTKVNLVSATGILYSLFFILRIANYMCMDMNVIQYMHVIRLLALTMSCQTCIHWYTSYIVANL